MQQFGSVTHLTCHFYYKYKETALMLLETSKQWSLRKIAKEVSTEFVHSNLTQSIPQAII